MPSGDRDQGGDQNARPLYTPSRFHLDVVRGLINGRIHAHLATPYCAEICVSWGLSS